MVFNININYGFGGKRRMVRAWFMLKGESVNRSVLIGLGRIHYFSPYRYVCKIPIGYGGRRVQTLT